MTSNNSSSTPRKCLLLALALLSIIFQPTSCAATNNDIENDDMWSQCNCPSSSSSSTTITHKNHAKMAYLITVHNRRTIHDGAHLLKSLMETSQPGEQNTAVILIHVDHRVGIANPAEVAKNDTLKNQFLYHESPLRRYVDACLANSCAHINGAHHKTTGNENKKNSVLLEVHSHFAPKWSKWSMNDPTLWAMEYLLYHPQFQHDTNQLRLGKSTNPQSAAPWDTFINLSGDTLPITSASRISQLFNQIGRAHV